VPLFDGVLEYFKKGLISGAVERNKEYASKFVEKDEGIGEELEPVFYDPQTSGGLLMCVKGAEAGAVLQKLRKRGVRNAAVIGRVVAKSEGKIILKRGPDKRTLKRHA
jgi:selenide,water dikinase